MNRDPILVDMRAVARVDGEAVMLEVSGELDALSVDAFMPVVDDVWQHPHSRWVIDLSSLRLIDSNGVRAIVRALRRIDQGGKSMTVKAPSGQPLAVFQLLRLDRLLREHMTRDSKSSPSLPTLPA